MLQNNQVYIIETSIIAKLKNKEPLVYKSGQGYTFSRYIYKYGEVPEPNYELYDNPNTVWNIFLRKLRYDVCYHGEETRFTKRIYLDEWQYFNTRIYKDELVSLEIKETPKIIENPVIEWLQHDLGFKGYTELLFNREKELKSMACLD